MHVLAPLHRLAELLEALDARAVVAAIDHRDRLLDALVGAARSTAAPPSVAATTPEASGPVVTVSRPRNDVDHRGDHDDDADDPRDDRDEPRLAAEEPSTGAAACAPSARSLLARWAASAARSGCCGVIPLMRPGFVANPLGGGGEELRVDAARVRELREDQW